ncbi:hypothetical protein MtrunA17_Chr3g0101371 [Medicago truncatula]|uniref:Uncharacterized protein n=1 Tax=Medicago truncatula TaxID=3880 RepID=A0A396INK8_MEDTR|nr:hypothetical protein MtrunA17_Chr3g0101371 [Medicago truncatula]
MEWSLVLDKLLNNDQEGIKNSKCSHRWTLCDINHERTNSFFLTIQSHSQY